MRDFITLKMRAGWASTVSVELDDNSTVEEVIKALCHLMVAVTYEPSTVQPYIDLAESRAREPL